MAKVELKPAFTWDCESCGRENFTRGVCPEMDDESQTEMRLEHGIDPDEDGRWMMMPTQVTCARCGACFETIHYGDEE